MAISYQLSLLLGILVYYCTLQTTIAITFSSNYKISSFNRTNFPKQFFFGSSSASYQYEGAVKEDGKGPSMWDIFTHKFPEKIKDHSNGDVADDSYNRYKGDVKIMKDMGFTAHRFSISWSRILPNGKLSGGVNMKGVNHYNNLINELLANGIVPFITLFHFDLPQALEDEYGGFLSPHIVNDFRDFTDICFKEFGDRVKHWITINEPLIFSYYGYGTGSLAPGRCSAWMKNNCSDGNSGTEPYLVAHHLIIAHATVVQLYKTKYQEIQKGIIGISLPIGWAVPYSKARHNLNAAKRVLDFTVGWFMEPFTNGHYPHVMQIYVGDRLPKFSKNESNLIKGSFDFIGVNYYTASYAIYSPQLRNANKNVLTDHLVNLPNERDGVPIGPKSYPSSYVYIYPSGIYKVLQYMKKKYQNPLIYITENGIDNNATLTLEEALDDKVRLNYYYSHLHFVQKAIRDGVNVKGYFAWSLLDNFEWASGFTSRFGLNFVDYKNGLKRYPKLSAQWFKNFLASKYPQ